MIRTDNIRRHIERADIRYRAAERLDEDLEGFCCNQVILGDNNSGSAKWRANWWVGSTLAIVRIMDRLYKLEGKRWT